MSSLWKKAMLYLGLVDEDQMDGEVVPTERESYETPPAVRTVSATAMGQSIPGERVEPPQQRRWMTEGTGFGTIRPVTSLGTEAEIIVAYEFADAQLLADHLRNGRPVVLDVRSTDPDLVRRLVDFASGLTYGLEGTMQKIAQGVILASPHGVTLAADERLRLRDLGLYELEV